MRPLGGGKTRWLKIQISGSGHYFLQIVIFLLKIQCSKMFDIYSSHYMVRSLLYNSAVKIQIHLSILLKMNWHAFCSMLNQLKYRILQECQTAWIQIRPNILLIHIWVQNVCKGKRWSMDHTGKGIVITVLEISNCPLAPHGLNLLGASWESQKVAPRATWNSRTWNNIFCHVFLKVLHVHCKLINNNMLPCCQLETT